MNIQRYAIQVQSGNRPLVRINDFSFIEDQITFLFGESGIGKSILCKAVYGLLDGENLSIRFNGASYEKHVQDPWTQKIKKNSFFVFQEPSSHLNPLMTITDQLNEGSLKDARYQKQIMEGLWEKPENTDFESLLSVYPKAYRPSGGEKQRILLTMAFKKLVLLLNNHSSEPSFFVFDEPTGSLDNTNRNLFLSMLFNAYRQKPFTAIVITHDYSIISEVVASHKNLLQQIHYKELSRSRDADVNLYDFSPQEYIGWLGSIRSDAVQEQKEVLRFEPEFSIFKRNLAVFKDPAHTRKCPLVIHRGQIVYVKAPSGVGKTTLAKVIMGIYKADTFSMNLCGMAITEKTPGPVWHNKIWGRKAGMVFQHADESLDMEASILESFLGLPLRMHVTEKSLQPYLELLFEKAMINTAFMKKKLKFLSGGQKQRLNLLRTLLLNTDFIILDEPLNALDFETVKKVLQLIREKQRQGAAILMISHNEEIFEALVDAQSIYYLQETSA